jgi:hypothetical protein
MHSILATDNSWFKNVWELVFYFNVCLQFNADFHLKPIRQGNASLMSEFIRIGGFSPTDLVSLNIMRMHKKVIHKYDIVLCYGKTIKAEMLMDLPSHSNSHKFQTHRPTPADLVIWKTTLCKLSSNFLVLTVKLQEYISLPHLLPLWLLNDLGMTLHHNIVRGNKLYLEVYSPSLNTLARRTRSGQRFDSTIVAYGPSNFKRCASMTLSQERQVFLHSLIPGFVPVQLTSGFENVFKGFANQSLWVSLEYDGDGSWILNGMLAQSPVIIHDGSYMRDLSPCISSVATMIYCMIAKVQYKCTWAEQSTSAGPYCGEILSGVMTQLILHKAASTYHDTIPPVVMDCDNNDVISH